MLNVYANTFCVRVDYPSIILLNGALSDFDSLELDRLRRIILAYDGDKALLELNDEELLKALGFIRVQNGVAYPTIAGILMIGKVASMQKYVPTGKSSFQVLEGTNVRVNEDDMLPILASIEKIITHLEVWNPQQEIEIGLFRMPAPEFDKRALREAIVNAFCHRDYSIMGRVRVAIEDEGLTIANPGGFIEGVTIQNLLTAEPHGRNPLFPFVSTKIPACFQAEIVLLWSHSLRFGCYFLIVTFLLPLQAE